MSSQLGRLYRILLQILCLPVFLSAFFAGDSEAGYGVGRWTKLKLVIKLIRNNQRILQPERRLRQPDAVAIGQPKAQAASVRDGFRRGLALLALTAAATVTAGCGDAKEDTPGEAQPLDTFVGRVEGSQAYIALIRNDDELGGYVTDGRAISVWLAKARIQSDTAPIAQRSGPILGEVNIEDDVAEGQIKLGAQDFGFRAERATGNAGLYEAAEQTKGNSFQAGWIVLPDGSQRGMYDTFVGGKTDSKPAPRLTATVTIPGFGPQLPHELTSIYFITLPPVGE